MEPQSPQQSKLLIPASILIGAVIVGGALIIGLGSRGASQGATAAANPQQQPAAQTADIGKVKIAGEPFIGKPNAPVTIAYWYDYQCPFCKQNEETAMPEIVKNYVDTGKVKVVFKDFQFLGPDSQTAGLASRAVWEVAPDKFYQWHRAMYDKQDSENSGWGNRADVLALTRSILGADNVAKIEQLMTKNATAYQKEMDADKAEGSASGVTGTPGFVIGKRLVEGAQPYAAIKQVIDLTLAGK